MTHPPRRIPRAVTLVELLIGLSVSAVLSTAITALLMGAANTNRFVLAQADSQSEIDFAQQRIIYNVRTAAAVLTWTTIAGFQTLSIQKTSVGTIKYYVNASNNLVEDDPRYNVSGAPNIIARNIATSGFACTITAPSGTQANTLVKIDLKAATAPVVERHATAAIRGF